MVKVTRVGDHPGHHHINLGLIAIPPGLSAWLVNDIALVGKPLLAGGGEL